MTDAGTTDETPRTPGMALSHCHRGGRNNLEPRLHCEAWSLIVLRKAQQTAARYRQPLWLRGKSIGKTMILSEAN